jgi:ubiquinone/menaquinone biosynthesis C-methylase UbiE
MTSPARFVRREYDRLAGRYDRRWQRYTRDTLALLRPLLAGRDAGDVLDLGCGTGALLPLLRAWDVRVRRCVGVDPSSEMLRAAAAKTGEGVAATFAAASADALPFRDAAFDTVVSASSLHFWTRPETGLREVRRVLRPGGRLLLLDWSRDAAAMRLLDLWLRTVSRGRAHHRVYSAAEARALLAGAGFRVAALDRVRAGMAWTLFRAEAEA